MLGHVVIFLAHLCGTDAPPTVTQPMTTIEMVAAVRPFRHYLWLQKNHLPWNGHGMTLDEIPLTSHPHCPLRYCISFLFAYLPPIRTVADDAIDVVDGTASHLAVAPIQTLDSVGTRLDFADMSLDSVDTMFDPVVGTARIISWIAVDFDANALAWVSSRCIRSTNSVRTIVMAGWRMELLAVDICSSNRNDDRSCDGNDDRVEHGIHHICAYQQHTVEE